MQSLLSFGQPFCCFRFSCFHGFEIQVFFAALGLKETEHPREMQKLQDSSDQHLRLGTLVLDVSYCIKTIPSYWN